MIHSCCNREVIGDTQMCVVAPEVSDHEYNGGVTPDHEYNGVVTPDHKYNGVVAPEQQYHGVVTTDLESNDVVGPDTPVESRREEENNPLERGNKSKNKKTQVAVRAVTTQSGRVSKKPDRFNL